MKQKLGFTHELRFMVDNSKPVGQTNTQNVFHFLTGKQHKTIHPSWIPLAVLIFSEGFGYCKKVLPLKIHIFVTVKTTVQSAAALS